LMRGHPRLPTSHPLSRGSPLPPPRRAVMQSSPNRLPMTGNAGQLFAPAPYPNHPATAHRRAHNPGRVLLSEALVLRSTCPLLNDSSFLLSSTDCRGRRPCAPITSPSLASSSRAARLAENQLRTTCSMFANFGDVRNRAARLIDHRSDIICRRASDLQSMDFLRNMGSKPRTTTLPASASVIIAFSAPRVCI